MRQRIAEYIASRPNDPMIPVLRAVLNGGYALRMIVPGTVGPYGEQARTCMVLLEDSGGVGPCGFALPHLAKLIAEADCVIVNAAPRNHDACGMLADGAAKIGRTILIETNAALAKSWVATIEEYRRKECGLFAIMPEATIH